MSKLTKPQIKAHQEACKLLDKDRLSEDEREFVVENWQESATHINSAAGAFFTPLDLAVSFSVEVSGGLADNARLIDLCAGIGVLSLACMWHNRSPGFREIVCVEKNPDYVAVGRKVLPEARWICGDVFDLPADLGHFEFAISNPPFGRGGPIPGVTLDLNVVAAAAPIAEYGVFILPSGSVPFEYSGKPYYRETPSAYERFNKATDLVLGPSCGIDCSFAKDQWRGVAPSVEIALCDFREWREAKAEKMAGADLPLFGAAA